MRLRVCTWNVAGRTSTASDGRLRAAAFVSDQLAPDVALLQEAKPHSSWGSMITAQPRISAARPWASAVVPYTTNAQPLRNIRPRHGTSESDLVSTWPGSVSVARLVPEDAEPVVVVSMYGLMDNGYAYTTLHKQISDLTLLLDSKLGRRVIVGGDLNAGTQGGPKWAALYRNTWERLELLGLVDLLHQTRNARPRLEHCPCGNREECSHVKTLKLRSGKPIQTDYLFATKALANNLSDCRVVDATQGPDPLEISDHLPVVGQFEL